jgi:hypothetical protein
VLHLVATNARDTAAASVLERLDPPKRAAVVMALLALVLTGLVLVTCIMLGGHWVRRIARHKPGATPSRTVSRDPAESRRLREALDGMLPATKSGDTVQLDASTSDTVVDPPAR